MDWGINFGSTVGVNDTNILEKLRIVTDITEGRVIAHFEYTLSGRKINKVLLLY